MGLSQPDNIANRFGAAANPQQTAIIIPDMHALNNVRPFVEVTFQKASMETRVSTGRNPAWHEELSLPFVPPQSEYTAESLLSCTDTIYLNMYDEIMMDMRVNSTENKDVQQRRRVRRWLGTTAVPVAALYSNQQLDGNFRVDIPLTLLGYSRTPVFHSAAGINTGQIAHTYLRLFITLDPPLRIPPAVSATVGSMEDDHLLAYAARWAEGVERVRGGAKVLTCVSDIKSVKVFVTRYVHPQAPPVDLVDAEQPNLTMARLARFVAAIPLLSDATAFVGGNVDRWCTSDQFLEMLAGDSEEHALLLCNFFLHIGVDAYCVFGQAIPFGDSVFVLTLTNGGHDIHLWDPLRAAAYDIADSACPLQHVTCVFNAANVWGNIQPNDTPSRMAFNFAQLKFWRPFFTPAFPHPGLSTVQGDAIPIAPPSELADSLGVALEQMLMIRFELLRPMTVTRWHRHACEVLRGSLFSFEDIATWMLAHETSDIALQQATIGVMNTMHQRIYPPELHALSLTYDIIGYALQMPYYNAQRVFETVHSTGMHLTASATSEVALAVHVHAYPGGAFEVWVYIAELVPK